MSQPPIRAKRTRTRPDEFLNAIPNRDLTAEDWEALDADQRELVRRSDLFEVPTEAEFKKLSAPADEPEAEPKKDEATASAHPATPHAGHPAPAAHAAAPANKEAK